MNQPKVMGVRGELFFTRANPWKNMAGYRYTADCDDSSSEVILSDTFSRYEWAYEWDKSLPSRGHMTALAARFTFSSIESAQPNLDAVAEFRVKW